MRKGQWLLTKTGLQSVTIRYKHCSCGVRYHFNDWEISGTVHEYDSLIEGTHIGVLNCANKLLVSIDILFEMREHVKRGEPPGNFAAATLQSSLHLPHAPHLDDNEKRYLEQKLYDCYFAFECLTERKWDNAICGICGICPVFQSGDGNCKNCTPINGKVVLVMLLQCAVLFKTS